jgi:hypothetical protein
MRIITLCLATTSLGCATEVFAQVPFDRSVYLPGDTLIGAGIEMHVISAANGDLIVSDWQQFENGSGPTPQQGFVHRFGLDGDLQWRTRITTPASTSTRLARAEELADGTIGQAGSGIFNDGMYLRLAADGSVMSARQYENGTGLTELYDVQPLNDSMVLIVGSTYTPDRTPLLLWADYDGNFDHAEALTIPGARGNLTRIVPCASGGYLVSGPGNGTTVPDTIFFDALIARLDGNGEVLWARRFEELVQAGVFGVAGAHELPDGTIRFFARSRPSGAGQDKVWMIALDADGSLLWKRKLQFPSFGSGFNMMASASASDSTFWLVGGYVPIGHVSVVVHEDGTVLSGGGSAVGTIYPTYDGAITADGQLATIALTLPPGGALEGVIPRLIKDDVVPTLCTPYTFTATYDSLAFDLSTEWSTAPVAFVQTDVADQLVVSNELPQLLQNCVSTMLPAEERASDLQAMPNPAHDHVTITAPGIQRVQLYDAIGNEVPVRAMMRKDAAELDTQHLEAGPYLVRVFRENDRSSLLLMKE